MQKRVKVDEIRSHGSAAWPIHSKRTLSLLLFLIYLQLIAGKHREEIKDSGNQQSRYENK